VLVSKVADMRRMQESLTKITGFIGKPPSDNSGIVLRRVEEMLAANPTVIVSLCPDLHHLCNEMNPEDAYPTDHLIDMLSSCVSAIRFGLEKPCHSRHAASAAQHIWKHVYGVSLFDSFTPNWEKDWIRAQLQSALLAELERLKAEGERMREALKPILNAYDDGATFNETSLREHMRLARSALQGDKT